MNTEDLISDQRTLALMIEKIQTNFKKDGPSRKTSDYLIARKKDLEKYWEEFQAIHRKIVETTNEQHSYFSENLYEKTYKIYTTTKDLIVNCRRHETSTSVKQAVSIICTPATSPVPSISGKQPGIEFTQTAPLSTLNHGTPVLHACPPTTSMYMATTSSTSTALPGTSATGQTTLAGAIIPTTPLINNGIPTTTAVLYTWPPATSTYSWQPTVNANALQPDIPIMSRDSNRGTSIPNLPPIKIPKFNGDYKGWKSFIDIFTNVIHNNVNLSNVEKMQYLLYHLEGDAKKVINHLQLSNNNYHTAIQLIEARYNNSRKVITTYIDTIIDAKRTEHRSQHDIIALFDLLRECLEGLKNLNCKTDEWSPIIVCLAMRKLDTESLRLFEESLSNPREMPSINELLKFLEKRYQVLEYIKSTNPKIQKQESYSNIKRRSLHSTLKRSCSMCNNEHYIYQCEEFKQLNVQDRNTFIIKKKLCTNCLVHNKSEKCKTKYTCYYCKKRHHTLLHQHTRSDTGDILQTEAKTNNVTSQMGNPRSENISTMQANKTKITNTLLPTAMVRVKNTYGQTEMMRALIDPGSQVSLITEEAVQNLKLQKQRISATILGVGETKSAKTHSKVKIDIHLRYQQNSYLTVEALVLQKLNSFLPEAPLTDINMKKFRNIPLADPTFDSPGPIDLLLGADVYANIITNGLIKNQVTAQNTKLGGILFGRTPTTQKTTNVSSFLSLAEIDQKLEKFWEIEVNDASRQNDETCEDHFKKTYMRGSYGKYIVRLPFKEGSTEALGQSKNKAMARLLQIEKKLRKNPSEMVDYNRFLIEYLNLGHMSLAKPYTGDPSKVFYLPHHAVMKNDSTTTKLRVVFDASCKTDSGKSLNDLLHSGPKIQQDLTQILLRWRKHRYVYTADIEKMFRQIELAEEDRNYQRILWRQDPTKPVQEFVLNTVTYGTAPATYLSVRVLQQLAEDEGDKFPIAKRVLNNDFYIDDMMAGADTKLEAQHLQSQIITLLSKGGFNLRKWTSNDEELLKIIPEDLRETGILKIRECDTIKTLSIQWNPKQDCFQFNFIYEKCSSRLTKRTLLSRIATIFDPLGWLAPVTLSAKIIMQSLWKSGTDWDQEPPTDIVNTWKKLEDELHYINAIKIPRWFKHHTKQELQIHGFCDASEKGYAASVYARTIDSHGNIHVTLLIAKTKVAPLRQKITLPRLELCGALLLAQLLKYTIDTLQIRSPKVIAWCDSEIVLAWISKNPNDWHTFVANRVNEIQGLFSSHIWRHVPSGDNPADIASRGINPAKLASHHIWWRGPLWLAQPPQAWPQNKFNTYTTEEIKRAPNVCNTATTSSTEILSHSTYTHQIRVIAYCLRFIKNCKLPKAQRKGEYLSSNELQDAEICVIKIVQHEVFTDEIKTLQKNKLLKQSNKLTSLHPFLDANGILRVGGRLKNARLTIDAKYQILLPQRHHITDLIIDQAHQQTLHGGTQLTLSHVRTRFWIINGKNTIQSRIHKCIRCARYRPQPHQQLMGNLPTIRITPSPPFTYCGIDYAGPFLTRMSKGRGTKSIKGYIALFICMVTKAVHLELVSDLSTDAFLAAFRRFIARRGNCKQIHSDNGTNFVGARNTLEKELQNVISRTTKQAAEIIANTGIEWKFIPPASPHFGGLWEAGVKSVKGHLKRVLGETLLTFEEFSTVLCQVEACLNSRPIGQLSSDPNDLEPLTPGHFLIGRPLLAPPQPDVNDNQIHQRWKLISKLQQDIWKRWSQEYLSLLQQRNKWKTQGKNPTIGELVLVKEDHLTPQNWSLGRITQLHPGEDGIVRIVSVKSKGTIKKRPLNKLCQLPINTHESKTEDSTAISLNIRANASITNESHHQKTMTTYKRRLQPETQPRAEPLLQSDHLDRLTAENPVSVQPSPAKRRRIKIAPCTWASKLLHQAIFILYWLTLAFAQDYEIYHPKPGLYVENMGHAQIKRGNLRIQVTFPVEDLTRDQKLINNTWQKTKEMCEKTIILAPESRCESLFQHMTKRKDGLLKAINEIDELLQHKTRTRRGVLGSLLTSIFGVNDEVYTDIEVLQHNQQDISHIMNQQALLLNARINQSNSVIEEKFKQFHSKMAQVIASVNEMTDWYSKADHNRINIEVISAYLSAEDYFDELEEKYNNWRNAMHNHGHLLNFISSQDIDRIIQNVSANIGLNYVVSSIPQNRLEIVAEGHTLKAHGYLNIIEKEVYDLIHVTPIPQQVNLTLAVDKLKVSTLAVSFNQQTYFNLEEKELQSCAKIRDNVYLCTPPIVYNIQESPSCIIDEIYDRHPRTKCEKLQMKLNGTIWKSLMMKDTWLYITTEKRVAAVICNGVRRELVLNNTGIIHLHGSCYIKTKEVTLKTTMDQTVDVISSHMKEILPDETTLKLSKPPSILPTGILLRPYEQMFHLSQDPDLQPHITLQKTLTRHSITATVSILSSLALGCLIFWIWKRFKHTVTCKNFSSRRCQTNNQTTTPEGLYSTPETTIKQHFDRVLAAGGPQHVQS